MCGVLRGPGHSQQFRETRPEAALGAPGREGAGPCPQREMLHPPGWTERPRPGWWLFWALLLCRVSRVPPRVQTQNRADVPVCPHLSRSVPGCPGPCSAGTVTGQAGSLCVLADAGALLSQGEVALVSPLPIARQLPSWPCSCSDGSLSCPIVLRRR